MATASTQLISIPGTLAGAAPGPNSAELREAFEVFTEATASFTATYESLRSRARELDVELAETNKRLERNLAEKERVKEYLTAILTTLPAGVVVVDELGRVKTVNPAAREMLGLEGEEAVGRPLREVFGRLSDASTVRRSLEGDFLRGRRVEIAVTDGQGDRRDLEVVFLAASRETRSVFGGVIVFHDVTQLKRLEQQAAMVSRLTAMGEMAMNVAHEIRNPLGSIELFASALARDLADRPHQRQLAEHVSAGVRSIESIVENILQFNRPRRLDRRRVCLPEAVEDSLRYADHLLRQREIDARVCRPSGPLDVFGDPELLKQVFLNLALNAAQAMEKGGRLEVRFSTAPGVGRVELLDSGPGIEPAMLGKIFDPFVTTRHKGTGLGLTIVHNIVTAHGGTVEISNRRDGGARAAVELPLWREKTDDAGRVEDGAVAPEA